VLRGGGEAVLTLPEVRLAFDPGAITSGQVALRRLTLVGAQVDLRRDRDGSFDLSLGGGGAEAAQDLRSLPDVLALLDRAFALPALSRLDRIDAEALTLTLDDRRAGRRWVVGDGRFTLRNDDAELALQLGLSLVGGGQTPAQATLTFVLDKASRGARASATVDQVAARDLATQAAPLAFLSVLEAPISGRLSTEVLPDGSVTALEGALTLGAGALHPTDGARPIGFDQAGLAFRYDRAAERITFSQITAQSPALRISARGHVSVPGIAAGIAAGLAPGPVPGLAQEFIAQIETDQVLVDPEGLFQEPVRFSRGAMDLRLRLEPFSLDIGQIALVEEGRHLRASGRIGASPDGWQVALDLALDAITHDRLLALWPVSVVPKTRDWLVQNVQEGLLFDVKAGLRLMPGAEPRLSLGYEFADADVRFLKTLPPIKRGHGYATIEGQTYTMVLDRGQVTPERGGTITMGGSVFSVLDITRKPAQAEIRLQTDSSVTAALSLLDEPPFRFMTKAGRPVDLAEGRARLATLLRLPLVPKVQIADVRYEVEGDLTGVTSAVLVPGKTLRAERLRLLADRKGLTISGPGQIGKVGFDATYRQGFGADQKGRAQVEGTVELSPATVAEFNIGLPDGSVTGKGKADITLDFAPDAPPRLTVTSALAGVGLRIAALGWSKPAAGTGKLSVSASLSKPPRVDQISLQAAGLDARGTVEVSDSGGLKVARFDRLRHGGWLDAEVTLTGRGKGRSPAVAVRGGKLDLRRIERDAGTGGAAGDAPLDLALDALVVSDGISLTGFRGAFSQKGGLNGTFTAKVNGVAEVQGTLVPARGGSAVRISSQDAGRVLASAGIFDNARGGELDLQLVPTGAKGGYTGTARATGFRVRNAPALAELLSAISVVGILEQMNGDGLVFSDADVEFRLTPRAVEITRGAAVGASLGVSMAGVYDLERKRMDMQGVVSPIYLLNGIGAVLTRRGEGLFGFNYRLTGSSDAPQVSVNPLSILTPGMFREIFRRPAPQIGNGG
jgi:hypothetical protein